MKANKAYKGGSVDQMTRAVFQKGVRILTILVLSLVLHACATQEVNVAGHAYALYQSGKYQQTLDYISKSNFDIQKPNKKQAYIAILRAFSLEALGRKPEAIKLHKKIIERFPQQPEAKQASKRLQVLVPLPVRKEIISPAAPESDPVVVVDDVVDIKVQREKTVLLQRCVKSADDEACRQYHERYSGEHLVGDIQALIESRLFQVKLIDQCLKSKIIKACRDYRVKFSDSVQIEEIINLIEKILWGRAKNSCNARRYQAYISEHPEAQYSAEAIEQLKLVKAYGVARKVNSYESYQVFLTESKGTNFAADKKCIALAKPRTTSEYWEKKSPTAHNLLQIGKTYHAISGSHKEAIHYFNAAIMKDKNLIDAFGGRGLAYLKNGQKEKALNDLEYAVELKSNDYRVYLALAGMYKKTNSGSKMLSLTKKNYQRAIEINPRCVKCYLQRAIFYMKILRRDMAIKDFSKIIKIVSPKDRANAHYKKVAKLYLNKMGL